MSYILLDESGDLGFNLEGGSSKYFIITFIFVDRKRPIEKIARNIHKNLERKFKKVGVLHAYNQSAATRQRLLKKVADSNSKVMAVILNKNNVYTKLQDQKNVLYNYVTNILLDRIFKKNLIPIDKPVTLIASKRETNRFLNENFKSYLSNQVRSNYKLNLKVEISTPAKEKSLQVADFVSWAIFRKYESGDLNYYELFGERVVEESFLF